MIPVKGERPFFKEALASLESQGFGDELEIIVQDGGAGSGRVEELGVGELHNVKWFREADSGQSDALNKGFAKARGEWLFWLNADDVLLPGALGKVKELINKAGEDWRAGGLSDCQIDRLSDCCSRAGESNNQTIKQSNNSLGNSQLNWIAGDTVYIDANGLVQEVRTDAKWRSWFGKRLSVWTGGPSAFFRRELWEKRGGFDVNLKYAMDIDLWTRWAKAGERFVGLGEYVWGFRMHDESKTGSGRFAAEQANELAGIDARYGVSTMGFWRNVTRVASLLDGTWSKRQRDTCRMRGSLVVSR